MSGRDVRWRLTVFTACATSLVVLALLIPASLLLRSMAEQRTLAAVTNDAQKVAILAAAAGEEAWKLNLEELGTGRITGTSVVLPDGHVIGAPTADTRLERARKGVSFTDRVGDDAVVFVPAIGDEGAVVVRMVVPQKELHTGVWGSTAGLFGLGAFLLIAVVGAAHAFAVRLISAPIRGLVDAANALQEGRLDARAPEHGPLEIRALARSLNRLATRIKDLLALERESVADLSHRLRTPVTALRLDADAVSDPEVADRLRQHVAHLEMTVDAVVREARLPTGTPETTARCDVAQVVDERVSFWSALAEDQGRHLRVHLPWGAAWARIDAHELADVVDVLVDNVFAHTDEGVPLEVTVQVTPQRLVALVVEDGGPGLPENHIVERGRSGAGSSGLGLDIVRRAAMTSGGSLEFGRSRFGGTRVCVSFAAAEPERNKRFSADRLRRDPTGRGRRRAGGKRRSWSVAPSGR